MCYRYLRAARPTTIVLPKKLASIVCAETLAIAARTLSVSFKITDRFVPARKVSKEIPTSLVTPSDAARIPNANPEKLASTRIASTRVWSTILAVSTPNVTFRETKPNVVASADIAEIREIGASWWDAEAITTVRPTDLASTGSASILAFTTTPVRPERNVPFAITCLCADVRADSKEILTWNAVPKSDRNAGWTPTALRNRLAWTRGAGTPAKR